MRIIQVIENFFPDSLGGTENYVLNIAKNMKSVGADVCVIAPSVNGAKEYIYEGVQVYRYPIDKIATKSEYKGLAVPKGLDDFLRLLEQIQPDVVHFNTLSRSLNIYHLKSAKNIGAKVFLTPHISGVFCIKGTLTDVEGKMCDGVVKKHNCVECYLRSAQQPKLITKGISFLSNILRYLPRRIYPIIPASAFLGINRLKEFKDLNKYADGVIAISKWIERGLNANGIHNTILVEQGISDKFQIKSKLKSCQSDKLRLLFVGRFYQLKGLHVLMNALSKIDTSMLVIDFVCPSNKDNYSEKIRREIAKYKGFHIFENLNSLQINELLPKYDFLILPSTGGEMSPLVVLEAFACGVPVIGSNLEAITDNVIDGVNGRIFNVGDSNNLAQILKELINDISQRYRLKSGVKPPRNFKDVSTELLAIYQQN